MAAAYAVLLSLLFVRPLTRLMVYAAGSSLHSHIVLVPLISAYLLHDTRRHLPAPYSTSVAGTMVAAGLGLAALLASLTERSLNDHLAITTLAFLSCLAAGGFLLLGGRWMRAAAFPIAFLIFMVPLPDAAVSWLEAASAQASAAAAALLFEITHTAVMRDGTVFELPGIVLRVARECSGIHSSWVLFITSVLASRLFLRGCWPRLLLVAFVIPLGILRNAVRIVVIGLLCVHVGPHMIDSPLHHRGGPLFFVLSLVPLLLLIWFLRRRQRATRPGLRP